MDFIIANQAFFLGLFASLIVWAIYRLTGKTIDKTSIASILTIILDIIQDIKTNPQTRNLDDYSKKQMAIQRLESTITPKKRALLLKVFGTLGGAVEYVYHNRKWLFNVAGKLLKKVT